MYIYIYSILNGNFRILKWRYCMVLYHIFGNILLGYSLKFRHQKRPYIW